MVNTKRLGINFYGLSIIIIIIIIIIGGKN
jgi:hypothetical protein